MSIRTCPNCGNLQGYGDFCSQCGHDLSNVKAQEIVIPDSKPKEYGALRFTASLMIFMGWMIVILSVVSACLMYSGIGSINAVFSQESGSGVGSVVGAMATTFTLAFGVIMGVATIAAGQVIMVILDIRDDVRKMTDN